jgi:Flp pilus assembly pilin Flp
MFTLATTVVALARRISGGESGQDLIEYAMICALIAVVAISTVTALGNQINQVFWTHIVNNF